MATVRTTTPRQDADVDADNKNKKRKRSTSRPSKSRATASASSFSNNGGLGVSPHADGGVAVVDEMMRRKLDAHSKWQLCTQKSALSIGCVVTWRCASVWILTVAPTMALLVIINRSVGDPRRVYER